MPELIIFYIENTIPGLLYITSGFFIYLHYYGIYNFLFLKSIDGYLPYIFLVLLALASVIGFSCQKILENIIYLFSKKYKYNAKDDIKKANFQNELLKKRLNHFYLILVLLRHLIIGTFFLFISIAIWLHGADKSDQIARISFILVPILIILGIVYVLHRRTFVQFSEEINNI
jgi:hypothetical protein